MKKIKELLQKPIFKKIISPVVRGIVKQVPIVGTPVVELITTITTPSAEPKKHTTVSQVIQWCIAAAVLLDLIFNEGKNLRTILDLIGLFPVSAPEILPI